MKIIYKIFVCVFLSSISLYSGESNRSQKKTPNWIKDPPEGQYYIYFNGIGDSENSLSNAKKLAISDAISSIVMEGPIEINSKIISFLTENKDSVVSEVMIKGKSSIAGLIIEENYWETTKSEKGLSYNYWILLKMIKSGYVGKKLPEQKGFGLAPVWRSALIPGWGQFYKGESDKGWRYLISETALVPTTFISMYFSQNYHNKAENERDYDKRKFYNDWSNRSYTIGTISGIVAGAIYVYNVFDSITAKGAKKYAGINSSPVELFVTLNDEHFSINMTINF